MTLRLTTSAAFGSRFSRSIRRASPYSSPVLRRLAPTLSQADPFASELQTVLSAVTRLISPQPASLATSLAVLHGSHSTGTLELVKLFVASPDLLLLPANVSRGWMLHPVSNIRLTTSLLRYNLMLILRYRLGLSSLFIFASTGQDKRSCEALRDSPCIAQHLITRGIVRW